MAAYKPERLLARREQFRQLIADGAARSKNRNHGKLFLPLIRCIEIDGRFALSGTPSRKPTTAVLQLLYSESTSAEWLFPQEKAALHMSGKGT
jgi:hypothetical protein